MNHELLSINPSQLKFAKVIVHLTNLASCELFTMNHELFSMKSIDPIALQEKIDNADNFILIDVREPWEHDLFNIGGLLIPMNTVFENLDKIPADIPVIIYCQKGIRSGLVIQRLQQKFHYSNLINLAGGMDGWGKVFPGNK